VRSEAPLNEKEGPRGGAFFLYESNQGEGGEVGLSGAGLTAIDD
jgi:hypothetical protein